MKKIVVVILHIGYWLLYFLLLLFIILAVKANTTPHQQVTFFHLLHYMLVSPFAAITIGNGILGFYSFYFILFPKYLKNKKILALILYGLLFSAISALIPEVLMSALFNPKIMFNDGWNSAFFITITASFIALIHGIIGLVMRGFVSWYGDIKLKEELTKRNYEVELALVKSQINPHFLFNTIHNIDVLIEMDPIKASDYLNKLSDIMRFMLYETKTEKINLAKELSYIEKYIELQKIRTSNTNYVNYSVVGELNGKTIESMLFIPFIENAFKHSENKKLEDTIVIRFEIEINKIIFKCTNRYTNLIQTKLEQSGLGNELMRRRLLLIYPNRHSLEILKENGVYEVTLIIKENEH